MGGVTPPRIATDPSPLGSAAGASHSLPRIPAPQGRASELAAYGCLPLGREVGYRVKVVFGWEVRQSISREAFDSVVS